MGSNNCFFHYKWSSKHTEFDYVYISGGSGSNFQGLLEVNSSGAVTGIEIINGGKLQY